MGVKECRVGEGSGEYGGLIMEWGVGEKVVGEMGSGNGK